MEGVNDALKLIAKAKDVIKKIQLENVAQAEDLSFAEKFLQDAIDELAG